MNCKIGDKVRFLNDIGGGIVVRFVSKSIVAVQDEDGFEIPVSINEIVVIDEKKDSVFANENYIQRVPTSTAAAGKPEDEQQDEEDFADFYIPQRSEEAIDPSTNSYNVLLGFIPFNKQNPSTADLDLYVINDSDYRIAFTVGKWTDKEMLQPIGSGMMEPDSKERICTLSRDDFSRVQMFNVSIIYFKNRDFVPVPPAQINLELNPLKFVKANSFKTNDYFDEQAVIFTVSTSSVPASAPIISAKDIEKSLKEKQDIRPKLQLKSTPDQEEIDLHIDALVDSYEELSNGEILEIQMARFTTTLEGAIRSKTKRIVFIHGVGNGKLKNEVRKTLERSYPKLRFQDASFKEYGYGATLVLLK